MSELIRISGFHFRLPFAGIARHVATLTLRLRSAKRNALNRASCAIIIGISFYGGAFGQSPVNVLQPGDPIVASSLNSPGTESVEKAIDGTTAKYLNFDTKLPDPIEPSGFVVSPSIGPTVVTGMTIQSANDAPERDPKAVTLEGSNDQTVTDFGSGNWELIKTFDVPEFTDRFQTQTFSFNNSKSYLHYRWTVTRTQLSNGCCMQVAEVGLLSVINTANCALARFVLQPVNQPVIEGKPAHFSVTVNGPWPLQWLKNGQPIPGATGTSFTTDPVTAENATNVYAVRMVDCETSDNVQAVIFKPSATKSIGINFSGWDTAGMATPLQPEDIVGIQLQAYWNNAPNPLANVGSGTLPSVQPLLDSDGNASSIAFDWQAAAAASSGAGTNAATDRLLNGLVGSAETGTNTFTFSNVPPGSHSLIVYALAPDLFIEPTEYTVAATTYLMRVMSRDEYNQTPGFYRSASADFNAPMIGDFVRFDGIEPDASGKIVLRENIAWFPITHPSGVNAIQLILNSGPTRSAPTINIDPQPAFIPVDGVASLRVTASGDGLTYQWRKDGRNIPNGFNIRGATSSMLTISNVTAADAGIYSVAVFNSGGNAISKNATVNVSALDIKDALVGCWKFDESSGPTVSNAVAGGFPGAIKNSSGDDADGIFSAGEVANSLNLDGEHFLFITNYTKATSAISGAVWVNIAPDAASAGHDLAIFRNAQGELTFGGSAFRIRGQFQVDLAYDPNDSSLHAMAEIELPFNLPRVTSPAAITAGLWHHIAFTADGAQLRLYVDGTQVAVQDYEGQIIPPDVDFISMGAQLWTSQTDPRAFVPDATAPKLLIGQLDDVALWTRALSPLEVWLVYNAGLHRAPLTTVSFAGEPTTPLTVTPTANGITMNFDGGKLQSAPNPAGPWSDVTSATSPHNESFTASARFFRTVAQ